MRKESANPEGNVAAMAADQHGVVTLAQLRASGIDGAGITRRVKAGRLHRVHRGVYAVGHPSLPFEGRCLAAALASGEGAAVSHRSAAALWSILPAVDGPIQITVSTSNGRKPQVGIEIHRSVTLGANGVTRRLAVPITKPNRTLEDLRSAVPRPLYLRAVRSALDMRLIANSDLRAETELTRSELERRFVALCRRHRFPTPQVNAHVGPIEVDFLWIDHALIAETDGFRYHGNRAAFESDRAKDAKLQALGFRVVRFTYRQVVDRPREVVGSLRA